MNRNKWIVIFILIAVFAIGIVSSALPDVLLLSTFPWLLIASVIIGIILGILSVRFKSKTAIEKEGISRHGTGAFIEHWLTALGIFLLIISGFIMGFLFFPNIANTPKSVLFPLNMHFIGLNITLLGGFYFLTNYVLSGKLSVLMPNIKEILQGTIGKYLLRKKWEHETKYLASQKSAFLLFAVLGGVQLITGSIKVMGHFFNIPSTTLAVTTSIHDIFSLLFIIMLVIHILFALLLSSHRLLLKSWFTGRVSESYAKENHKAWYDEITKG
jgi:cytochrome b subunit of formate dehydrogenase